MELDNEKTVFTSFSHRLSRLDVDDYKKEVRELLKPIKKSTKKTKKKASSNINHSEILKQKREAENGD